MNEQMIRDIFMGYSVCVVEFTKKDGTHRTMHCTQDFDYIPEESQPTPTPEGGVKKPLSNDVLRVYDFAAQGWRSFSFDSVINVNFYEPRDNF